MGPGGIFKARRDLSFRSAKGSTEWKLSEYDFENHHQGRTDERLVPKEKGPDKQVNIDSPFRHVEID